MECLAAFSRATRKVKYRLRSSDLCEKKATLCESQCLQYKPVGQEKKECVAFYEYVKKRISIAVSVLSMFSDSISTLKLQET